MRSRPHTLFVRAFVSCAILAAVACGDSPTEAKPKYDGNWVGSTSDGRSISFSVSGTQITELSVGFRLSGSCNASGVTVHFAQGSIASIAGRSFVVSRGDMSLNGSFSSGVAASGTGSFSVSNAGPIGCSSAGANSWTARR